MSKKNRNENYQQLLNAIEFYVNDKATQDKEWFEILTEALEFLKDNYAEVSALRRCCHVMENGKPISVECYQYYLSEKESEK